MVRCPPILLNSRTLRLQSARLVCSLASIGLSPLLQRLPYSTIFHFVHSRTAVIYALFDLAPSSMRSACIYSAALTPPILKKGIGNESHLSLLYCFPFKHLGTPKKAFCCSREIHRTEVPFSDPMLKAGRVYQAALLAFCS